ncbi:3D domain-containing protein [Metabacillus fastidiosus]|uniref:3D domain-containing protein n=1 Tax=Metabacillus fastidiosus TaxID=1458 RepID=A0ABU6P097_9BACI|nr:3D domain-containing protein [Metabacillus fastidiosus]MED4402062.1 3D domain-containing protein [Metabacillus fastidiosus]
MYKRSLAITLMLIPVFLAINAPTARAESATEPYEQQLLQEERSVVEKEQQKEGIQKEISSIMDELNVVQESINIQSEEISGITEKIKQVQRSIEEKKREIITLQDKTLVRYNIMKKRIITLQENNQVNIVLDTVLNSKGIDDFLQRIIAINTLMRADNDILKSQKENLIQIQKDKEAISDQENILESIQDELRSKQKEMVLQLDKKKINIKSLQSNYQLLTDQIQMAEQNKKEIEEKIKQVNEQIKREQQEAAMRAQLAAQSAANEVKPPPEESVSGVEMYVESTAYSWEETYHNNYITKLGYNIKTDPTLKLIAVDPSVIPLGSKVWVEGYGEAIAGDTGGKIKGHIIDVLMHSKADALKWGRKKVVKIIVLK